MILVRLNLSITKIRGQCHNGASSTGDKSGVATRIMEKEPKALYTHVLWTLTQFSSNSVMKCKLMRMLDIVYEITKLIKKSPHHTTFLTTKQQLSTDSPGI